MFKVEPAYNYLRHQCLYENTTMQRVMWGLTLWLLAITSIGLFANTQPQPKELYWEDMVPKGFVAPEVTVDHMNNMTEQELKSALNTLRVYFTEEVGAGLECPVCKRFTKLYKRKLNSGMARMLIGIYRFFIVPITFTY